MKIRVSNPKSGFTIAGGKDLLAFAGKNGFRVTYHAGQRLVTANVGGDHGYHLLPASNSDYPHKVGSLTVTNLCPHFGPITVDAVVNPMGTLTFTLPNELPSIIQRAFKGRAPRAQAPVPVVVDNNVTVLIEIDSETISYRVPKRIAIKVAAICQVAEDAEKKA